MDACTKQVLKTSLIRTFWVVYIIASAREKLLSEMKGMDKKIGERSLLRLVQSYEDEHWTIRSSEDYKVFFRNRSRVYF